MKNRDRLWSQWRWALYRERWKCNRLLPARASRSQWRSLVVQLWWGKGWETINNKSYFLIHPLSHPTLLMPHTVIARRNDEAICWYSAKYMTDRRFKYTLTTHNPFMTVLKNLPLDGGTKYTNFSLETNQSSIFKTPLFSIKTGNHQLFITKFPPMLITVVHKSVGNFSTHWYRLE